MFASEYENPASAAHRTIAKLESLISKRRVSVQSGGPRLIFLCGANRRDGKLSARRQAIVDFAQRNAPSSAVIIAEEVFRALLGDGEEGTDSQKNLFDLEKRLSDVADHILIVLEGEGAFCELGAFAHESLRSKLLVINNSAFRGTPSFVNLGPIAAVREKAGEESIMWYPMRPDGVEVVDSIGRVFPQLMDALSASLPSKRKFLGKSELNPQGQLDKLRLLFVHDLIFLVGPMKYPSLVDLLKIVFGPDDWGNLRNAVALLKALSFISYPHRGGILQSLKGATFLDYGEQTEYLRISFSMLRIRGNLRARGE